MMATYRPENLIKMNLQRLKINSKVFDFSKIGEDVATVCVAAGFAKTKSEARRLIAGRAIKLHGMVVEDQFARLSFVRETNLFILMENE